MAVEIVMPRVDMDMSSGRMGRWHAAEGAHVVKGATLFEIETDKAAMEVDAPASGVLKFVAASEGDVLPVGACIGWIVAEGETFVPPPNAAATRGGAPGARRSWFRPRRSRSSGVGGRAGSSTPGLMDAASRFAERDARRDALSRLAQRGGGRGRVRACARRPPPGELRASADCG